MPPGGGDDILHDMDHAESDRGAALLGCSTVEFALQRFLVKHMVALSTEEEGALFSNGALCDFSGRISVAYAFGLINSNLRNDLMNMKDIRNAFGHSPQRIGFDTDAIKSKCEKFTALAIMSERPETARHKYTSAVKLIFSALKFSAVRKELPLPFGTAETIWAVPAPSEPKMMPWPEISREQLLQDLQRAHRDSKTPPLPPEASQA